MVKGPDYIKTALIHYRAAQTAINSDALSGDGACMGRGQKQYQGCNIGRLYDAPDGKHGRKIKGSTKGSSPLLTFLTDSGS